MDRNVEDVDGERTDLQRYIDMAESSQTGWWESDIKSQTYTFSNNICKIIGIEGNSLSFEDTLNLVSKEYRESFKRELYEFSSHKRKYYERFLPITTPHGVITIKTHLCYHYQNDKRDGSFGVLQVVPTESAKTDFIKESDKTFLLKHFDKVSALLADFISNKSEESVINNILQSMLDIYGVDYAYMLEFNDDKTYQRCVYEVCRDGLPSLNPVLNKYSNDREIKWSNLKMGSDNHMVFDDIIKMPQYAIDDYNILNKLGVKSMMMLPLVNDEQVWGSIGLLTVKKYRRWTNDDYMWFMSTTNVISICVNINRAKAKRADEERDKEKMVKYMPIAYARLKLIRNSEGEIVDYIVREANDAAWGIYDMEIGNVGTLASQIHDKSYLNDSISFFKQVIDNTHYMLSREQMANKKFCHRIAYVSGNDEIVEFLVDITETIKAQIEARRSDKLFKDIFINIPIGEAIYDTKGSIKDMNNTFMDIFGVKDKNGNSNYNLMEDRNMSDEFRGLLGNKEDVVFRVNYDFSKVDNYDTRRTGMANLNCKLFKLYDEEECIGYMLIVIEDTDKIMAINKARDFENLFSLISDYAKVGYAKLNLCDYTGQAVRQWYKNMGDSPEKPINGLFPKYENMHPDDKMKLREFHRNVLAGKSKSYTGEIRVRKPGTQDEWNWIFMNLLLTKYAPEDGEIDLIGVNYDITAFKEIEKELTEARDRAEAMDRLKSTFLANMSHEIRTPLNAIVGFSDLIVKGDDDEDREVFGSIIQENSDLLLQLINDILDLSKMEVGLVDFTMTDVDVNAVCSDIVKVMKMKANNHVEIRMGRHEPACIIRTDRNRLMQVITNFFTNAIKFTFEGSITLSYERTDDNMIRFSVTDTGMGISKEDIKKVFQRFVKLNTFVQGTGLGLSICSMIVEQMGGKIGADSEIGKGSTFWFTLPAGR